MLVKFQLSEYRDNFEKGNVVLEVENGLCFSEIQMENGRGRQAIFCFSYYIFFFKVVLVFV